MNKFIKVLCLTLVTGVSIFAQNNNDEYKKNEYYVGYSHQQVGSEDHSSFNGFQGAYVRNISRYFGIKGDFSGVFRNDHFQNTLTDSTNGTYSYRADASLAKYDILGGVQIRDNTSKSRFKPFGHVLAGVSVNRFKFGRATCTSGTCAPNLINSFPNTFTDTNFAFAVGGGLDIKINDHVDFRAIQVDYNPVFNGRVDHNVRFGVGFVFK